MEYFKKLRVPALVLSLLMLCTGCAASNESAAYGLGGAIADTATYAVESTASMNVTMKSAQLDAPAAEAIVAEEVETYAKKIIYTAYLRLRADVPAETAAAANEACAALGGYMSASYITTFDDGEGYASATLKVPADRLETLLDQIAALGTQEERNLFSDDVTQSYYDIQARLNTAKTEEKTLLALLSDCETVEEVLLVREQLASVRAQIESYQTSIDLWDHQVAYATVELTVEETEKTAVAGESSTVELWKASDVGRRIVNGFDNSWRFLVNAVSAVGIALSYLLLPCAVFGAIVYGIVKLIKNARRAAKRRHAERKVVRAGLDPAAEKKTE